MAQRVRGVSFKQEYRSAAKGRGPRGRAPSMVSEAGKLMLPPQTAEDKGRVCVVFDLDETLIYAREGPLYARPGLDELLTFCHEKTEPVVWTAGVKAYAQAVVRNIDKKNVIRHCVYRHKKWFSGCAGYNKDLTLLGRDMNKLIILENTPDCVRGNEANGIVVEDYEGGEAPDMTLYAITALLRDMVDKCDQGITIPQYIQSTPHLSKQAIPTDLGDTLEIYCLETSTFLQSKAQRVNKDL
eukprot:TRINITY_DN154_c0_g1_i1.p3 TRINITY_DN154_c0_g1~~TRINITY_DN154_c0_g1_i1.p3  ORF type:complete len:241 (+),score=96.11 TRINITY_DN154_c0_g1_i1:114-836(+)